MGASNDIDELNAAADAYARLKNYDAAARIAREASGKFPENTEALFRLASSLERAGNSGRGARRSSCTSSTCGPTTPPRRTIWATCGPTRACSSSGRATCSRRRSSASRATRPTSTRSAGPTSAWASCDRAERNLREAYRREPSDPTIEEHIGDLDAKPGNIESAVRHWEKALAAQARGARARSREAPPRRVARHAALSARRLLGLAALASILLLAACAGGTAARRLRPRRPRRRPRGADGVGLRAGAGGQPAALPAPLRRADGNLGAARRFRGRSRSPTTARRSAPRP